VKILYVEDNATYIRLMERIGAHTGHDVLIAKTGADGLKMLNQRPDIIFVDIGLPDIDGLVLTETIRAGDLSTPIIALTAFAMIGDSDTCLASGCTDYLSKPFKLDAILRLLQQYLP
jgi:CheY-like chemotaxis protein